MIVGYVNLDVSAGLRLVAKLLTYFLIVTESYGQDPSKD